MKRFRDIRIVIAIIWLGLVPQLILADDNDDVVDFDTQVRPILSDRCFTCHGPDGAERQADLRLDQRESAMRESESGYRQFVIKPGGPEESELLLRLTTDDEDLIMPPADSVLSVTPEEAKLIEEWIKQGAVWSGHWAFDPIKKLDAPEIVDDKWSRNQIDKFVLSQLQELSLKPNEVAPREVLARRVYFDLTGLPPTIKQLDEWLANESPDAYERLVDKLLSSSAYGERMAVDWLDVARYSDTHGYQLDFEAYVWPYRDWVVKSFNQNLPYDKFITWQLAGDLLPQPTTEQRLATAFNRLHRQTNEGGSVTEEFRQEYVADRVDTFGVAFLGLSVGCARCHDHKFDPIAQKEYYQLAAYFDNIDEIGVFSYFTKSTPSPALDLPTADQSVQLKRLQDEIDACESALAEVIREQEQPFARWLAQERTKLELNDEVLSREKIAHFDFEEIVDQKPEPLADKNNDEGESDAKSKDKKQETPVAKIIVRNLIDSIGDGEIHESPKLVKGKNGKGLTLNGDNGFTSPVTEDLTRHDEFTFALWIKTQKKPTRATVLHTTQAGTDAGNRGIEMIITDGKLEATLCHYWPGNAMRVRTVEELPVGQWVHVAFSYDGSSQARGLELYVNGSPAKSEIVRDGLTRTIRHTPKDAVGYKAGNVPHHLTVGYRYRDRGLAGGTIDELTVFERELNPIEVQSLAGRKEFIAVTKPADQLTADEKQGLFSLYLSLHSERFAEASESLRQARVTRAEFAEQVEAVMVMKELPTPRPTHILNRGAYDAPGEEVEPGVVATLLPLDLKLPKNRLGLAKWLTDPNHPLTSRVAVNRIWQSFLNRGLVATQEDFGSQGGQPSHPELLDYLSHDFVKNGWDTKRLVKQIVMSATYRQSSKCSAELMDRDPENTLLARGPSKRLTAEMIRDGALAASGLLVNQVGGPPVKPYQPAGLWKESQPLEYERDKDDGSWRRSIYSFWRRTLPPPSMLTFDAAKREICTVRRESTGTPLQALVLLNDPQYVEASRVAAQNAMLASDNDDNRVTQLYRSFTSRSPTEKQLEVFRTTLENQKAYFSAHSDQVDPYLSVGDHVRNKSLDRTELAAMTVVAQMMMNLDNFVMKR